MSQATMTEPTVREPINGVDVATLFATIDAVNGTQELAEFQFRATNEWQAGTHSKSTVNTFYGAGAEQQHVREFTYDVDHPEVLVGADNGPLPVELVLVGLASCLTAGIGNIASARGVKLESVKATVEGDLNLLGVLGLSDEVRNGYQKIKVNYEIKGDAPAEKLEQIVMQSKARSAVFDIVTNQTPVEINIVTG